RQGDHRRLNLGRDPVLQQWFAARQLLQRQFAAFVVKVFEVIEAVAAVARDLASLADVAELLGEFEQTRLGADDVSIIPRQTILPAASITQTAVRLPPTSSPANIVIAALHSFPTNHQRRVNPAPESSNLMYGMYYPAPSGRPYFA